MALVELATAQEFLGISAGADDDALTALIERVSEIIERELDWYFGSPRAAVEILSGTGTDKLFLRQPPTDEGALVLSNRSGVGGTWETVDPDLYEVEGRGIYANGLWVRGSRNFRASYSEGFDSVPGDIEQLTLEIVGKAWATRKSAQQGISGETIGDYSYTRGSLDVRRAPSWSTVAASWRRLRL